MRAVDERLAALRATIGADFPLSESQVLAHRERLAEQIMVIHDVEAAAVEALKSAIS